MPKCAGEKDATEILPNLWLGNHVAALSESFLNKFNIKHVINVTKDVPNLWEVEYLHIPIEFDETCDKNLNELYDTAASFIYKGLKQGHGVLVHCMRGHHRSASIVCAFLIRFLHTDHIEGIKFIQSRRICTLVRKQCMVAKLKDYYIHSQICKCLCKDGIECNCMICNKD